MKKIYLASPYSSNNKEIEEQRFKAICKIAGELILKGYFIFSPIAHSHSIHIYGNLKSKTAFWEKFNNSWIDWCDELWIANMPYWFDSKGISREVKYAKSIGKKIVLTPIYDNEGDLTQIKE